MKPLEWIGSARDDLRAFPAPVRTVMGYALRVAQAGDKHAHAVPLEGFKGSGVLEVIDDYDGDTYRTVYTVRLSEAIFVLHAFQKKSKRGIKTPKRDIDLINKRLKTAEDRNAALKDEAAARRGQVR